jgi:hypothetical protein
MKRRLVLELGLLLAVGYIGILGTLCLMQDRMLFPRDATPPPAKPLPAAAARWALETGDGARLHGVHLPAVADGAEEVVIGFAGNAWNGQDFALFLRDCLPTRDIVVFHYRGYAPSEGDPGERALLADGLAIAELTAERLPAHRRVALGVSLGSGVAAHLVAEGAVAGGVLVTPFDSIRAIAQRRYWWAPVGPLLRHPFDSAGRLAGVERPIAVIAAARDELVPPARTEALVDRLDVLVHHHVFPDADHGSIYDEPRFPDVLQAATSAVLNRQRAAAAPPPPPPERAR